MPRMDGLELIARIRASEDAAVRDIPAAALTALARSEDRIRAIRCSFEIQVSKPSSRADCWPLRWNWRDGNARPLAIAALHA